MSNGVNLRNLQTAQASGSIDSMAKSNFCRQAGEERKVFAAKFAKAFAKLNDIPGTIHVDENRVIGMGVCAVDQENNEMLIKQHFGGKLNFDVLHVVSFELATPDQMLEIAEAFSGKYVAFGGYGFHRSKSNGKNGSKYSRFYAKLVFIEMGKEDSIQILCPDLDHSIWADEERGILSRNDADPRTTTQGAAQHGEDGVPF